MIEIKNLSFAYSKKQPPLFQGLDCTLQAGSIVGLLGKNGAGKTSLLKLMTGLLFPTEGTVSVMEHQPLKREPSLLQDLYFVSEEFYLPSISIKSYVKANAGFYPKFDKNLLEQLIKGFELPETKSLQKLSYGQKKKFLISFGLLIKCKFLVLDEPTNGLDIPSKLNFTTASSAEGNTVLYSEMVPGGYKIITPQNGSNSQVDIELLFNAILSDNQKLTDYVQ